MSARRRVDDQPAVGQSPGPVPIGLWIHRSERVAEIRVLPELVAMRQARQQLQLHLLRLRQVQQREERQQMLQLRPTWTT